MAELADTARVKSLAVSAACAVVLATASAQAAGTFAVVNTNGQIGSFRIDQTTEAQLRTVMGKPIKSREPILPAEEASCRAHPLLQVRSGLPDRVLDQQGNRQALRLLDTRSSFRHEARIPRRHVCRYRHPSRREAIPAWLRRRALSAPALGCPACFRTDGLARPGHRYHVSRSALGLLRRTLLRTGASQQLGTGQFARVIFPHTGATRGTDT